MSIRLTHPCGKLVFTGFVTLTVYLYTAASRDTNPYYLPGGKICPAFLILLLYARAFSLPGGSRPPAAVLYFTVCSLQAQHLLDKHLFPTV